MKPIKIDGKVYGDVAPYDVWVSDISHPSGEGGYHATVDFHKGGKNKGEVLLRVKPHDGRRARYIHESRCSVSNLNQ